MAKLITVRCYDPIAADKNYRQPFSDVWISFTGKPARKKYKFGPTLVALPALKRDLEVAQDANDADEIADCEKILKFLAEGGDVYVDPRPEEAAFPSVYTAHHYIDRLEAERMIAHFMRTLGFAACRFKWRRPKFTMVPTLV